MKTRWLTWIAAAGSLLSVVALSPCSQRHAAAADASAKRVLIVAGPSKHPPGTHETAAGARVVEYLVEHAQGITPARAEVVYEWPKDRAAFEAVDTVVFTGDLFPGETLEDPAKIKSDLGSLMDRGCGIVCIHYATGVRGQHVAEDGDHPLLRWIGGYFSAGCPHHRSAARVCTATLVPEEVDHPVLRGVKAFTFDDEPYWKNYFGKNGPADNVTPLVTSMLPPDEPKKEIVAWSVERPDGGRGMGIVVPHYFRNWQIDDLRTLILNGVCWTARLDIPQEGIRSSLPDLDQFKPASVEPKPRPKPGKPAK